ncbi:MAG: acetate kinase, partial [Gemmobacter sp.]
MAEMRILVLNAGSSSLKFAVHDAGGKEVSAGRGTEIGASARIEVAGKGAPCAAPDHAGAMRAVLGALGQQGLGLG